MSIGKPAIPFTYEDYMSLPESPDRHELIDGELYVTPPPRTTHQIVSKNLQFALESHARAAGSGLVLYAPVSASSSGREIGAASCSPTCCSSSAGASAS